MSVSQKHPYHLVDPSPWPLLGSLGALASTIGGVMYMHSFTGGGKLLSLGLGMILYTMFVWWRDVIRESTYEGHHTFVVQLGLRYGMILFIVSEVMFFLAFFWAFFHSPLAPTVEIGAIWPPKGIDVLNPWGIPFLNTLILLSSGAAVTWAHHAILAGFKKQAVYALVATRRPSDHRGNFLITFRNHTIADARNETDATYHVNQPTGTIACCKRKGQG
jgi:cytochrome c oxidase subunit 3